MSASPPPLKAQLYNRAEVKQYSEKLLAQVGPQKPNTIPKLGQNKKSICKEHRKKVIQLYK